MATGTGLILARGNRFAVSVIVVLAAACASTQVTRRAVAITNADQDARQALALEGQIDAARIPARSFAVLPFTVVASDTLLQPLGFAMANLLVSDLAHASELQLVERMRLDALLKELDLIDVGAVDPRGAPRVGRLVGARRLLIGDIRATENGTITLTARLVDVIAGTVEKLLTASAPLARVLDAEKALAMRIFEELGITLTVAQRSAIEQRQTSSLEAMVAFGRGVQAEAHGDAREAVRRFEDAARLDAAFAMARTALDATPARGGIATSQAGDNKRDGDKKNSGAQRSSGLSRVADLAASAVNAPTSTKLPEAVDVPVQSQLVTLLITVKVP